MDMRTGIFGEIKSSRSECTGVVGFLVEILVAKDSYYFVWPAKVIQNKGEYNSSVTNYTKKRPTYLAPQYNYYSTKWCVRRRHDFWAGPHIFPVFPIAYRKAVVDRVSGSKNWMGKPTYRITTTSHYYSITILITRSRGSALSIS